MTTLMIMMVISLTEIIRIKTRLEVSDPPGCLWDRGQSGIKRVATRQDYQEMIILIFIITIIGTMIINPLIQPAKRFMILNTKLFNSSVVWNRFFRDICGICAHCFPGWSTQLERITKCSAITVGHNCRNSLNPRCYTFEKSSLTKLDKSLIDRHIGKWLLIPRRLVDIVAHITRIPRVPFPLDISEMRPHIWQKYVMSFHRQPNSRCLEGDWSPTQTWGVYHWAVWFEMHLDNPKKLVER